MAAAAGDPIASCVRESVADAVDSEHVARTPRIGFELPPDVLDVGVDGALERFHLRPADRVEELRAREDPPRLSRERRQQLKFGCGEVDRRAGPGDDHPRWIDREICTPENV